MADDVKDDKANEEKDENLEVDENEKGDGEEEQEETKKDPELEKAIKRRDAALARAKKAEEALAARDKKEGDDKPDPVEVANRRLVAASARTVLASAGVTDKDDQKAVIAILNLSDIDVDDEDGPDEDAISERISDLRRILGGKAPETKRRVPSTTSTKDKGGNGSTTSDPDAARYRAFMAGRS